jgi:transcription factor SFP1
VEETPLHTPKVLSQSSFPRKHERDRDLYFSWHRKGSPGLDGPSNLFADSTILESELDDEAFPLFEAGPAPAYAPGLGNRHQNMAPGTAPIDISQSRHNSHSPRGASNLTNALQAENGGDMAPTAPMNIGGRGQGGRSDSISMSGLTPQFSKGVPIAGGGGRSQPRRESLAGSMMNGMSWGGVSMNSWVRDE